MDLQPKLPRITIKPEDLLVIPTPFGDFHFTNSMLFSLIVMVALVIFFAIATRRMSVVPKGAQNLAEAVVEFLLGLVEGTAGKVVGRRIFPLIATLFIFILVANWSSLLPGVGTIGTCIRETSSASAGAGQAIQTTSNTAAPAQQEAAKPTGGLAQPLCKEPGTVFVPFLRAANADLNMTLAMALIAVVVVQVAGIAAHGGLGYLKELTTPIFLAPIHITGELARVISLSFRLFGNVFGGEVLVTVMYVLLGSVFIGFATFIFLGLELLFGFIQAVLFSVLTLVFISSAVGGHAGEQGAEHGSAEALGQQVAGKITGHSAPHAERATEKTAQHVGG